MENHLMQRIWPGSAEFLEMNDKPVADAGKDQYGFPRYRLSALYLSCAISLLLIFFFDLFIPPGVAVGVLYAGVILLSLWLPHEKATLSFALISSFLIVAAFLYKPPVEEMWKVVFNRGIALFTVWIIASLGLRRKKMEQQRNSILLEREKALQEVKILRGLLPICASCKKIKDHNGYWTQIEGYIKSHSEAEFTHGICPECAERLYPDFFKKTDFYRKK